MTHLAKYLKPFIAAILLTMLLLFAQANADLALPDYMSRIVNVGIQQGGVENAVPEALRQVTLERLFLFMSAGDQALVQAHYTKVDTASPDYATYVTRYPALVNEAIAARHGPVHRAGQSPRSTTDATARDYKRTFRRPR